MNKNKKAVKVSFDKATADKIIELRSKGLGIKAIAKAVHKRDKNVSAFIAQAGLAKPAKKPASPKAPKNAKKPAPATQKSEGVVRVGIAITRETLIHHAASDFIKALLRYLAVLEVLTTAALARNDGKAASNRKCKSNMKTAKKPTKKSAK